MSRSGELPFREILRGTSRSFYLSVRFLPAATRAPVALAYLLARAADTLADTAAWPAEERRAALDRYREALGRDDGRPPASFATRGAPTDRREAALLERVPDLFRAYGELDAPDRSRVRAVLGTLTGGMLDDLRRFPGGGGLRALDTAAELDAYTYAVAGCVGEFWTRLHADHLPSLAAAPLDPLVERGVRLGKGLQLVNVLRDLPRDLTAGRCYLPREELATAGLAPEDLLDPTRRARARPIVAVWLERAAGHFAEGFAYVRALPAAERRLRLCSWWPLALGLDTLALLRQAADPFDPSALVKVGRGPVYKLLFFSWLRGASDAYLAGAYARRASAASV